MYRSSRQDADALEESSKRARSGFKRKKLNVAGSYQEIKVKRGLMMTANPKPSAVAQGSAGQKPQCAGRLLDKHQI